MQEEEYRTTNMEEGQKGNSGTWTNEDNSAQQLAADKNINLACAH